MMLDGLSLARAGIADGKSPGAAAAGKGDSAGS